MYFSRRCALFTLVMWVAFALSACVNVPDTVWHPVCEAGNTCSATQRTAFVHKQTCAISAVGRDVTCDEPLADDKLHVRFHEAFLEYKEQSGRPWDDEQLKAIRDYIQGSASSGHPLLVSVYVHGWHHNAKPDDDNLLKFRGLLARYADGLQQAGRPDVEVLGVYVGWRGQRNVGPFNFVTIGDRAAAADTIGWGGPSADQGSRYFGHALEEIAADMRAANADSRMVIMGHSLGARVVTRALLPQMLATHGYPLGPHVLVTTVNAAIGADVYSAAYVASETAETPDLPTWMNLTSSDDGATLTAYKWGARLGLVAVDHPENGSTDRSTRVTIGHYPAYTTHELGVASCDEPGSADFQKNCGKIDDVLKLPDIIWTLGDYRLSALSFGVSAQANIAPSPDLVHCVLLNRYPTTLETYKTLQATTICHGPVAADLDTAAHSHPVPVKGKMWNVLGDKSVIDFETPSWAAASTHNGYVQTDLVRLFLQFLYAETPSKAASISP